MNTFDRRIRKTKKALHRTLIELLKEKDLHSITVKELTDRADVHRTTFYSHYQDVPGLYQELEDTMLAEFASLMQEDPTHSYVGAYKAIIEYACENTELAGMFFGKAGTIQFRERVKELLEQQYLNIWLFEENTQNITEKMHLITAYHIQGCIGVIEFWVKGGFRIPKEDIIELIQKADYNVDRLYC